MPLVWPSIFEQMGHSAIDVTVDTYGHLVPGGNRHAVDRLDDPDLNSDQNGVETEWKHFRRNPPSEENLALQVIEKTGATRQNRTGDLQITKNTSRLPELAQPEKKQQKQGK